MHRFRSELWLYQGSAPWHFVTLPRELSDRIAARHDGDRVGFGSVRVSVRIGATRWSTSIFPDKKAGAYVLPIKRAVRDAEGLAAGDTVTIELEVAQGTGAER